MLENLKRKKVIRRSNTFKICAVINIITILIVFGIIYHYECYPKTVIITEEVIEYKESREGWYVIGTYYNAIEGQCDGDPYITASGYKIDSIKLQNHELRICAVSQDFFKFYNYKNVYKPKLKWHDTIIVESNNEYLNGEWVVEDYMNARYQDCIDFLLPLQDTLNFGKIACKIKKK